MRIGRILKNMHSKTGRYFEWFFGYCLLFVLISAFLNRLSVSEIVLTLLYQVVVYALPGVAIILLLGIRVETDVELLGYTFIAGYCYNIILYYIIVPLGIQQYVRWIGLILGALSLFIIYKKRGLLSCKADGQGMKICSVGAAGYALLMFVAYNGNGITPNLTGATDYYTYHRDILYWIGNLNSLMKQYPPISPREYSSGSFNYHYFSSLQLAIQSLFTGIDAVVTCIGLYFHATIGMIVFGTYLLAWKLLQQKLNIILALCALLLTSGVENFTKVAHVCHYALSTFGTDYGLGVLLFLLYALYQYCQMPRKNRGIVCIVLLAVLTGTKGPYAAVALCGIGGICLFWLIQKKVSRAVVFGAVSLVEFGLVYYFVCNTSGYEEATARSSYRLLNLVIRTDAAMSMVEACMRKFGRELLNLLLMKPAVVLPFIGLCIILVYHRKRLNVFEFGCLCMAAVGFAINAVFTMPTGQHVYFAMAALIPAWCFVLGMNGYVKELFAEDRRIRIRKTCRGLGAVILSIGVICFIAGNTYGGSRFNVIYSMEDGIKAIRHRITGTKAQFSQKEYWENGYIFTDEEYEALHSLQNDNEPEAIMLHTLPETKEQNRRYRRKLLGSFSGKYIMGDEAAVDALVEGDEEELRQLYVMGVRYILADFWQDGAKDIPDEFVEEIYAGERIKLYKILEK